MTTHNKPDVNNFKKVLDQTIEDYLAKEVRPYLSYLLAIAQSKLPKRYVGFDDGMGMSNFYINPERHVYRLSESINAVALLSNDKSGSDAWKQHIGSRYRRYADRFPELVLFMQTVYEIDGRIGQGLIGTLGA